MSRFAIIDLASLGRMDVLETLDSEFIIDARMAKLVEYWAAHDPPAAAQYDVDALEFDPLKINQENNSYFELLVRDRVNQAARAVTLAFATGHDLQAIASRYPGGVPILPVVVDPRPYDEAPIDWETDDRYRRRIQASVNPISPHGAAGAYLYWALTADPLLRDASEVAVEGTGEIIVTCLADIPPFDSMTATGATIHDYDPRPSRERLIAIRAFIQDQYRRGATDIVTVRAPKVIDTKYRIDVWLYPGPERNAIMARIKANLDALVEKQRWLGYDHTLMVINGAMAIAGVHHADILEPAANINASPKDVVRVTEIILTYKGRAE